MTQTELQQLIERVDNDLDNNWAVDKDDIRKLVNQAKITMPLYTQLCELVEDYFSRGLSNNKPNGLFNHESE